ncbi:integration host factor subunit alpha [Geomonas agri]|uniref:integration host factor subunit alpha n=1 Tax=Geomonas agri TaxID=2873702 RepID=UPI001CD514A2|nr:integration host factor subunit alpha [Geomonas agri]
MTKADIAERMQREHGITKLQAVELVESVLDLVKDALVQGEEVKIAGFGKFTVKAKADRKGRNPQTGEDITIEARRIVTWRPSTILKGRLN